MDELLNFKLNFSDKAVSADNELAFYKRPFFKIAQQYRNNDIAFQVWSVIMTPHSGKEISGVREYLTNVKNMIKNIQDCKISSNELKIQHDTCICFLNLAIAKYIYENYVKGIPKRKVNTEYAIELRDYAILALDLEKKFPHCDPRSKFEICTILLTYAVASNLDTYFILAIITELYMLILNSKEEPYFYHTDFRSYFDFCKKIYRQYSSPEFLKEMDELSRSENLVEINNMMEECKKAFPVIDKLILLIEKPYEIYKKNKSYRHSVACCNWCLKRIKNMKSHKMCGSCKTSYYCNQECQKLDYTKGQHQSLCSMFSNQEFSQQKLEKVGKKFLKKEGKKRGFSCSYCGKKKLNMKQCSRCRINRYCTRRCQINDWKTHKPICVIRKSL